MKKILFIIILATTFIPGSQTGASMGDTNVSNKFKTNESQTMVKQVSVNEVENEAQMIPGKIKKEERTDKISIRRHRLGTKSISSEKRDRLFGLLLLAHGGQR